MRTAIIDPVTGALVAIVLGDGSDYPGMATAPVPDNYDGSAINYVVESGALVPNLSAARAARYAAISARFEARLALGCASPKGWVDCDDKAQGRIANILQLRREAASAGIAIAPVIDWTMYDKSQQPHAQAELVALGIAIGFGFSAIFGVKQSLEAAVAAAASIAAIDAIDIEEGWP